MTSDFTHLHLHSEYSILDGFSKIDEIPRIAKELGQSAVGLTDHGTLAGGLRFWKSGKEHGILTLQGMEAYITPDLNVKEKDTPIWHMVLLAMNQTGLDNLRALSGVGWTEGFYKKPRIDYKTLERYSEGIIATTGCMAGEVARALEYPLLPGEAEFERYKNPTVNALNAMQRYKDIFGDRLYAEVQPGNPTKLNTLVAEMAQDLKIKPVVTVDSHYDTCENKGVAELLLIMQQVSGFKQSDKDFAKFLADDAARETNILNRLNKLWPNRTLRFDKHDLHIMSRDEVVSRMDGQGFDGNALADTTLEIAERCSGVEYKLGANYLPQINKDKDSNETLRELVYAGLADRGLDRNPKYIKRAEEELATIQSKNFSDYFLIVGDIIAEARRRNIYVGPGRGSAAGSLVAYALKITSIDPIEYGLLFFRFINAERNDFPDIDMDFEHLRRDEMKEYVREKYGEMLSLPTFAEFKAKGLIRSIARALSIPLDEVNAACKHFETLEEYEYAEATGPFRAKYPEILPLAQKLEGHISGTGMHAAGVVVASVPMNQIVPIETRVDPDDKKMRVPVSAFDMTDAEELGLIKFDFLGLNTLTVIHDAIDMIKERHGVDIDWENLTPNDPAVLSMLDGANTVGVFQMESSPYRKLLKAMGVDNFNDLVASNALVRPGAFLTVAQDYIKRKKGIDKVTYPHEDVESWLNETYGVYIYQEQVMALSVVLGDFSWGKADKLRKIIGKKKDVAEFLPYYEGWLEGAGPKIGHDNADKMWHDFEKHAGYSFNKSHSVCYGYIGYVTAYLKYHYPLEYIYALLKTEKKDTSRMTYLLEAKRMGIEIKPPHINYSQKETSIDGDGIRFGLSDVRGVGFAACDEIIEKRPFASWEDFNDRIAARKCNSRVVESLVAIDGFNGLAGAPSIAEPEKNYQHYLNFPIQMDDLGELPVEITNIEDIEDEEDFNIVCGVIKAIKRTEKYVRLEIEDMTGNTTAFGAMSNDLKEGEVALCLIGDKTMVGYARLQGLRERIASGNLDRFESFLVGDSFKEVEGLRRWGIGKIGGDKALVVPLQVREVTTRAGKQMAFAYLTDGEVVAKVTVFPKPWEKVKQDLIDWVPVCVKMKTLDDGGFTIWNDGIINAKKLLDNKMEMRK